MKIAIIVGGSDSVFLEIEKARELVRMISGENIFRFVINDMIPRFPEPIDYAVTLHPAKLGAWLGERERLSYPKPTIIYGHRKNFSNEATINCWTDDWGGSSGLFAVKIALELKFEKIILCGVPMDKNKHFVRQTEWNACYAFRRGWETRQRTIAPFVRSFSGWTRERLGEPTAEWLTEIPPAVNG